MLEDGTLLTGGGVDGRLAAWDANKYFSSPLQEVQVHCRVLQHGIDDTCLTLRIATNVALRRPMFRAENT